ncbi:MAG: radical SAM protein [Candidatus Shapirobacteria bacterium]|jgi:radical SAM superfamily enzyme YgiQ (UPF0313 family)
MSKTASISAAKFSIAISYPPIPSPKGSPLLTQNRQFQWTNTGNHIYPVIPASAATLLSKSGYQVYWDDAISTNLTPSVWFNQLLRRRPNLIVIETKTPVVKYHWQIIKKIKNHSSAHWSPIVVLMGDHVTAMPKESLQNSPVDYVLTGGDYDFMLQNLCDHLTHKTKLEPGFWYRSGKTILTTGQFSLVHHQLDSLPIIDRELTQWQLYAYHNNNYRYLPGAYIMSGRDCWWGKCAFCSWTTLYPGSQFRCFSVDRTVAEITNLVDNFHVREIFDDSGTLPVGQWLDDFCHRLISTGLNKKIRFSCNLRFGSVTANQYQLMAKAGFRLILYGFESANQTTLDRINKNNRVENAEKDLKLAKRVGLQPHVTIMLGYPWETTAEINNTLYTAKSLFRQGLIDSMQATIVIPYPGTPLFSDCKKQHLLLSTNWNDYDMRHPVIKTQLNPAEYPRLVQQLFKGIITPKFMLNQVLSIRSFEDFQHLLKYTYKFFQKLKDFSS